MTTILALCRERHSQSPQDLKGKLKLEITVERTPLEEREARRPAALDVGKD
jgi:hypothetical protein